MNEMILPNIAGAFLQGRQITDQRREAEQINQLRALQLQQGQNQLARDEQFRNALGTYLQGGTNALAQMYAADPERAMQAQQFQQSQNAFAKQQRVEQAKQGYASAQYVLQSKAPKVLAETQFPKEVESLKQQGFDWAGATDDDVRGIVENIAAQTGVIAGILPGSQDTDDVRTLRALSRDPDLLGTDVQRRRASAQQVNVNTKQETKEAQTVGEEFGKQYAAVVKAGADAPTKLSKLDRMEQLAQGVQTGKLTPAITQVTAIAESLGFKVDPKLGAKQGLEALSNEIALQLRNPSGGAGMPGAMSDKDREFLVSMTPGLAKTPEGNRLIIETARKLAKRDQEVAKLAREYRRKNGSMDEGFYDELAEFSAKNPLFGEQAALMDMGAPTATGPNGEKLILRNGQWVQQ